jgi:aryl-alcohol dehydrogenase-like predicted oxidoreductase
MQRPYAVPIRYILSQRSDGIFLHGKRSREYGVLDVCEELGIGFVPWGPVGMGYLTGTIDTPAKLNGEKMDVFLSKDSPLKTSRRTGQLSKF